MIINFSKNILYNSCYNVSKFSIRSSTTAISVLPTDIYKQRISNGSLASDEHQLKIIGELDDLHRNVTEYKHENSSETSIKDYLMKVLGRDNSSSKEDKAEKLCKSSPLGLYLYGSVGCGKTMLMDLFHESCNVHANSSRYKRIHFHAFMLDIHKRIHNIKQQMPKRVNKLNELKIYDPIKPVAESIAEETTLLCFDEFQVTDIADAMILKKLFSHLWMMGIVVIATSNRPPSDLYKNGLQRINFLPFIPMLNKNCQSINLDSGIDYRRKTLASSDKTYLITSECDSTHELDTIFDNLAAIENSPCVSRELIVLGRKLFLKKTCGRVVDIEFSDLCSKPLGAVDYLRIAEEFDTIILRNIPRLTLERKNEGRRFITLIDAIYDTKMRLICSAETASDDLFIEGELCEADALQARVMIGDLNIDKDDENAQASLFTGEEEMFAFERVRSRLTEMKTNFYWNQREQMKSS